MRPGRAAHAQDAVGKVLVVALREWKQVEFMLLIYLSSCYIASISFQYVISIFKSLKDFILCLCLGNAVQTQPALLAAIVGSSGLGASTP